MRKQEVESSNEGRAMEYTRKGDKERARKSEAEKRRRPPRPRVSCPNSSLLLCATVLHLSVQLCFPLSPALRPTTDSPASHVSINMRPASPLLMLTPFSRPFVCFLCLSPSSLPPRQSTRRCGSCLYCRISLARSVDPHPLFSSHPSCSVTPSNLALP